MKAKHKDELINKERELMDLSQRLESAESEKEERERMLRDTQSREQAKTNFLDYIVDKIESGHKKYIKSACFHMYH